jgi:hypothetical protein
MRKFLNLTTALLVASAFAGASVASAAPPKAAPAKTAKAASATASGTIESYDGTGKTLTVKGAKASWTFNVADAKVWLGAKSVGTEDLVTSSGSKVTVKYHDHDGQKVASTVHIAAAKPAAHTK